MLSVAACTPADLDDWIALRRELWPQPEAAHRREALETLARPGEAAAFLARAGATSVGFAEAALRHDYVNGCETSPVAFLEGILVTPAWRRRGAARLLVGAVETWAQARGCAELASDADVANAISHDMHRALGFAETERVVFFRKRLRPE